jgi:anti-anti-sigma factor
VVEFEAQEKQGDRGYLRLRGTMVGEITVEEFKHALERHYVDDGVTQIVVDLSDVTEISLEGVATLLLLQKESHDRGKRFVVQGDHDQVRRKLEITGALSRLEQG